MPQTTDNHAFYLAQIHQLKQLQKVDDIIYDINKVIVQAPKDLKTLQDKFAKVEMQRERILDKIRHLRDQDMRLTREMEEESERLKKSKDKLMATGNEREYNAVTREIETMEKMTQPREDERVALLDELKIQESMLEDVERDYTDLKVQVESRQISMEEDLKKAQARLAELDKERLECCKDIPKPIFQRYEFIRMRLEHPVIVSLSDAICPSCHIAVPPQTFNDLLRGGQILSCPNCQRLIVWRDDYIADDPQAQAEVAAQKEQEASKPVHKKTSMGRSAALERDFKDEKEDVDFGSTTSDDFDEHLHDTSIESDLSNMSRMADVSDLADMSEMTGLADLGDDSEDAEHDKHD